MPKYKTSNGESLEKKVIDRRISKAKEQFLQSFFDEHGYYFCQRSGRSDLKPLDISHIISVRICQSEGKSELAYSLDNFELLCRKEHLKFEDWSNQKRKSWYEAKKQGMSFETFEMFNYEN